MLIMALHLLSKASHFCFVCKYSSFRAMVLGFDRIKGGFRY